MKKIFLTGVSGCIGHYIAEILLENPDYELYFLVRNPEKLKFTYQGRSNVHILLGDMENIGVYAELLKTMNIAVLIATSWGGERKVIRLMW